MSVKPINNTTKNNFNKNINIINSNNYNNTSNIKEINNNDMFFSYQNNESDIEDVDINSVQGNSSSIYSDVEDIFLTGTCSNITGLHSKINDLEYEILCSILQGKKLGDIVDDKGQIKKISDIITEDEYEQLKLTKEAYEQLKKNYGNEYELKDVIETIDDKLNVKDKQNQNTGERIQITPQKDRKNLSDKVFDCVIDEIAIDYDCAYDAIRLIDTEGNYSVYVSGTDMNSGIADALADLYPILKNDPNGEMIGNILSDYISGSIIAKNLVQFNLSEKDIAHIYDDKIKPEDALMIYAEKLYKNQKKANEKFLEDTIELAKKNNKKVDINGYSLGGGHALTGYANLCLKNPEYEKYIRSVNTYDAAVVHTELEDNGEDLINYISQSDKTTLFVTQGDFVGTFNNSMEKLKDVTFMLPVKKIKENSFPFIPKDTALSNGLNWDMKNARQKYDPDGEYEEQIYHIVDIFSDILTGDTDSYMNAFFSETHYMDSFDLNAADNNGNFEKSVDYLGWKDSMYIRTHPSYDYNSINNQYNVRKSLFETSDYIFNQANSIGARTYVDDLVGGGSGGGGTTYSII